MIKLYQNTIPFKRFVSMMMAPVLFIRKDRENEFTPELENHEYIHFEQQKELLFIWFYILYLILWPFYGYRNIPFKREAYKKQDNLNYLSERKRFSWLNYF